MIDAPRPSRAKARSSVRLFEGMGVDPSLLYFGAVPGGAGLGHVLGEADRVGENDTIGIGREISDTGNPRHRRIGGHLVGRHRRQAVAGRRDVGRRRPGQGVLIAALDDRIGGHVVAQEGLRRWLAPAHRVRQASARNAGYRRSGKS